MVKEKPEETTMVVAVGDSEEVGVSEGDLVVGRRRLPDSAGSAALLGVVEA
jgi:hypothetical protein